MGRWSLLGRLYPSSPQLLYRHSGWYSMSKIQDMRNDFRFRRAPRRTITKNKIDLGVHEQLMAIRLGLAEDVRK